MNDQKPPIEIRILFIPSRKQKEAFNKNLKIKTPVFDVFIDNSENIGQINFDFHNKQQKDVISATTITTISSETTEVGTLKEFNKKIETQQSSILDSLKDLLSSKQQLERIKNIDILYISSNNHLILEAPWEKLIDNKNSIVIREVISQQKFEQSSYKSDKNLLIISSYAYRNENTGKKLDEGPDKGLRKEVKEIINAYIKHNEYFNNKINSFLWWNQYTNKDDLKDIKQYMKFNYVHFAMHGVPSGGIYVSRNKDEDREYAKEISTSDLINYFNKHKLELIFFSTCHSAGGLENLQQSPCFTFINEGIAKYAIGYVGEIKNNTATKFAKCFYEQYFSRKKFNGNIKDVYREALNRFKKESNSQNIPYLYTISNQEEDVTS